MADLFSLHGKKGLILGLANEHSIAWGCAQLVRQMGADVVATCLNDKARKYVEPLTQPNGIELVTCNVEDAGAIEADEIKSLTNQDEAGLRALVLRKGQIS